MHVPEHRIRFLAKPVLAVLSTIVALVSVRWLLGYSPAAEDRVRRSLARANSAITVAGQQALPYEFPCVGGIRDVPQRDGRFRPQTIVRHYYPDNPRGYFRQQRPGIVFDLVDWRWGMQEGARAEVNLIEDEQAELLRCRILDASAEEPWRIHLEAQDGRIVSGTRVRIRMEARARAPHPISIVLAITDTGRMEPLQYIETQIGTDWQSIEHTFPPATEAKSWMVSINLGARNGTVDIAGLVAEGISFPEHGPRGRPGGHFVEYKMGDDGLRDIPRTQSRSKNQKYKSENSWRLVCLGDSFTFGTGVHAHQVFSGVLEAELNRAKPGACEVRNVGLPATGTRDQRKLFEELADRWEAKTVLVTLCFNDNINIEEDRALGLRLEAEGRTAEFGPERTRLTAETSYQSCMDELAKLALMCRERGATFGVVLFWNDFQPNWQRMADEVLPALAALEIPCLNLKEPLERAGLFGFPGQVHLRDGHPNEQAHALAAREIAAWLESNHLLP